MNKILGIFITTLLITAVLLFGYMIYDIFKNTPGLTEEDGYYTYAVIFYPDMKKSIEGFVDYYRISNNNICTVVIEGNEYIVDSKNVIFTKKEDDFLKKEVVNEKNRNDD